MSSKAAQLNIRASALQKAKLTEAARLENMNVSQFVLSRSLAAADELIADRTILELRDVDFDAFTARLEQPATPIKQLRALFNEQK